MRVDWNPKTNMDGMSLLSRAFKHVMMGPKSRANIDALNIIVDAEDRVTDAMMEAHSRGSQEAA